MVTYKDRIKESMELLAEDHKTLFIGYGLKYGGQAAGTLKDVSKDQMVETPVAEGLMLSTAIGLSIDGYKPVVFYERFDFIMNAMDALVNHLDKIDLISSGEYKPKVIIRCVIGGKQFPFFTGVTHTQDFTEYLQGLLSFPVIKLTEGSDILSIYREAQESDTSCIIVEEKDLYNTDA